MNDLAAQQRALVDALGFGATSSAAPTPSWVRGAAPSSPRARLDVYRRSYRARLVSCLESDFPRVRAVLGGPAFEALAVEYLAAHPASFPALRDLGRDLPGFVERRGAALHGDAELALDLARLEWVWVEVFDAPDRVPLERASLAAVPAESWSTLRFEISPACRIATFGHAVERFDLESPDERPEPTPTTLLIWRKVHRVFLRRLDSRELAAMRAARSGASFGQVCELATGRDESVEDAAAIVVGLLTRWIDDHLVVGVHKPQSSEPAPRRALEEQPQRQRNEERSK